MPGLIEVHKKRMKSDCPSANAEGKLALKDVTLGVSRMIGGEAPKIPA